jgi:hypothetical protein
MNSTNVFVLASCLLIPATTVLGEEKTDKYDLSSIPDGKEWKTVGRKSTAFEEGGRKGVRFDQQRGVGIAWITGSDFTEGTIDVDLRGQDKAQQSFLGIAFRVKDEVNHDAIYFRPFNFKADNVERKSHSVQYVSHPQFPWEKLRKEKPGAYENTVSPIPDPNGWFHAKIVISKRRVSVYVDDAKEPCLVVNEIGKTKGGAVGLWAGDNSGGDFANLTITPSK